MSDLSLRAEANCSTPESPTYFIVYLRLYT